ncbi:uncharacterized protein LOC127131826 [Lathyrus oleraceus]|uniref:uncharacterized protein LOC127131826 n=1 Tax=Pisum sativum TaxID=3888 RepID=UPI0021CE8B57|nr:uncharacterized protein LOC127131826 [Pisum sativum]
MVCLSLEQVDVILGMNWLELNHVLTNYFDKSMQFPESKEDVDSRFLSVGPVGMSLRENDKVLLRFSSRRVRRNVTANICDLAREHEYEFNEGEELMFVSTKKVRESVKDGAQLFVMLASMEATGNGVVRNLLAVCEFPEVFPKDISDLPPEEEIEFTIDLVPNTSHVSIALYKMFASELCELKKKLEELLEKRLFRPSVSP